MAHPFAEEVLLCHAGQQLLRSEGIFHIVDRSLAVMTPDDHRIALTEVYSDAAKGTTLTVHDIDFRPVASLSSPGGIPMPHEHIPGGEVGKYVLISVQMRKP